MIFTLAALIPLTVDTLVLPGPLPVAWLLTTVMLPLRSVQSALSSEPSLAEKLSVKGSVGTPVASRTCPPSRARMPPSTMARPDVRRRVTELMAVLRSVDQWGQGGGTSVCRRRIATPLRRVAQSTRKIRSPARSKILVRPQRPLTSGTPPEAAQTTPGWGAGAPACSAPAWYTTDESAVKRAVRAGPKRGARSQGRARRWTGEGGLHRREGWAERGVRAGRK